MNHHPIYLDGHSTTPVDPRVLRVMMPFFTERFGNPTAASEYGEQAALAVEDARRQVAELLGVSARDVVFTSGATESINIVIQGFCREVADKRPLRIGLTPVEHKAVLRTVRELTNRGQVEPVFFHVDSAGRLDLDQLEEICRGGIDLICVMKANNEIGNIYPVEEISAIATDLAIPLFTDATQAVGWIPPTIPLYGADLLALSAHKIYGPKGTGALATSARFQIDPLSFGGGQERGRRPGTHNVPGIVGLGAAAKLLKEHVSEESPRVSALRDHLEGQLAEGYDGFVRNGDSAQRLPNNLNASLLGVPNDVLLARLRSTVSFSLGSACTASEDGPSHVLRAMNLSPDRIQSAVRFGLTRLTTETEINEAAGAVLETAIEIRRLVSVAS